MYSRIIKRVQSDKMSPRVEIECLVRYVPKNMYKVWFPHKKGRFGRVDVVRDAVFDESRRYRPDLDLQEEPAISSLINDENPTVLTLDEAQNEISAILNMPMSVARIALQEQTEHTKQGEAPDTNPDANADIDADTDLHLDIGGEREITPVASSLKSASGLPLTPESEIRPTNTVANMVPR